jgi:hypothetical protein
VTPGEEGERIRCPEGRGLSEGALENVTILGAFLVTTMVRSSAAARGKSFLATSVPRQVRGSGLERRRCLEPVGTTFLSTAPPYFSLDLSSVPLRQTSTFWPGLPLTMASVPLVSAAVTGTTSPAGEGRGHQTAHEENPDLGHVCASSFAAGRMPAKPTEDIRGTAARE